MTRLHATLLGAALIAACGTMGQAQSGSTSIPPARVATADSVRHSHTAGDVAFMQGMIHHHAQALVMSAMAPTHGASPELQTLAARIINGQRDEIARMQEWLRDRGERVPRVAPSGEMMHESPTEHGDHPAGHEPMGLMPGMLTPAQMAELDAARGFEFDLLFLTRMIMHHEGALTMVEELFATYGAGQGEAIFRLAADIDADQRSDIERMRTMLRARMFETADSP